MLRASELPEAVSRAEAHSSAGRAEQADVLCQQALEIDPDLPKALMLLSVARIVQSDFAAAEALLRRGCASHPRQVVSRRFA